MSKEIPNFVFVVSDLIRSTRSEDNYLVSVFNAANRFEKDPEAVMNAYGLSDDEKCVLRSMDAQRIADLVAQEIVDWRSTVPTGSLWPPAEIPQKGVVFLHIDGAEPASPWTVDPTKDLQVRAQMFTNGAAEAYLQKSDGTGGLIALTNPTGVQVDPDNHLRTDFTVHFDWTQVPAGDYKLVLVDCSGSYQFDKVVLRKS